MAEATPEVVALLGAMRDDIVALRSTLSDIRGELPDAGGPTVLAVVQRGLRWTSDPFPGTDPPAELLHELLGT
jgi:hypothetical protein